MVLSKCLIASSSDKVWDCPTLQSYQIELCTNAKIKEKIWFGDFQKKPYLVILCKPEISATRCKVYINRQKLSILVLFWRFFVILAKILAGSSAKLDNPIPWENHVCSSPNMFRHLKCYTCTVLILISFGKVNECNAALCWNTLSTARRFLTVVCQKV